MKISVMGCGNMGRAIISGLIGAEGEKASVTAYDKIAAAVKNLPSEVTVSSHKTWFKRGNSPDAVLIAVKPQDVEIACADIKASAGKSTGKVLWISIAAGISIEKLQQFISPSARICRVMPNTPALIGQGISACSFSSSCIESDRVLAQQILGSCGRVVNVPEKLMDAVTGLSGSGPAYVYLFIESLIEGGVTAGLPYDIARQLAVQTVLGSAAMLAMSDETPSQLKAKVMSPGGTTAKGLMELEKQGFKYGVISAVTSAARKSSELGKKQG